MKSEGRVDGCQLSPASNGYLVGIERMNMARVWVPVQCHVVSGPEFVFE